MLLEAVNSVFLTFLATEYLLGNDDVSTSSNDYSPRDEGSTVLRRLRATFVSQHSRPLRHAFAAVLAVNAFVRFHAAGAALAEWAHSRVGTPFRVPRIVVAMCTFLMALYGDCRHKFRQNARDDRSSGPPAPWSDAHFFRQLAQSFCKLLPVYPFLAVIISFGFLFVVSAFEKLHISVQILNMPIYYGTLYGPLMMMYWDVKKTVVRSGHVLPR